AQNTAAEQAANPTSCRTGGRNAVSFQKIKLNSAHAAMMMTPSRKAESIRRAKGALCSGMSMPGRFSQSGSWGGSIVMPPRAGGGGATSGASRIRGRPMTGSANWSRGATGGVQERGNSMIFAVAVFGTVAGQMAGASIRDNSPESENAAAG